MRAAILACLALLTPLASAGNLHVGVPGSGAPYTSIHAAVADAQPGDSVIVGTGVFPTLEPLVIDKPLTILGKGSKLSGSSDTKLVQHPDLLGKRLQPLRIVGLAAGEEVRILGISIHYGPYGIGPSPDHMITVEDCDGTVILGDLSASTVRIEGCSRVILDDCEFYGRGPRFDGTPEVPGLAIVDSVVAMTSCELKGGKGEGEVIPGTYSDYTDGGAAVVVDGGSLDISASSLVGGTGGSPGQDLWGNYGAGGPGLRALASTVRWLGGTGSDLRGGDGGESGPDPFWGHYYYGPPGESAIIEADATLVSTPDASFDTPPVVHGTWTQLAERAAVATSDLEIAYQGMTLDVDLEGEPGSTLFLVLGFDLGTPLQVPGAVGTAHLDLVAHVVLATIALDPQGTASFGGLVPPWPTMPALIGDCFVLQGVAVSPTLALSFSTPTVVGIQP